MTLLIFLIKKKVDQLSTILDRYWVLTESYVRRFETVFIG